jgi:hypothetical protein
VADPNQTPTRGEWACPCTGCQKAVKWERKQIIDLLLNHKSDYLENNEISDYTISIDNVILMIEERNPKPRKA